MTGMDTDTTFRVPNLTLRETFDMQDAISENNLRGFCVAVRDAGNFADLRHTCVSFMHARGVKMMSYHHLPPLGARDLISSTTISTHGFPKKWISRYLAKGYAEIDPIPKHALRTTRPFWWSEARDLPYLTDTETAYLHDLVDAHLGDGLAIPVFGPAGRNGYCGLGFGTTRRAAKVDSCDAAMLQWACQLAHLQYCDLLSARISKPLVLSPREREILEWVARGKSNTVIAQLLEISSYTVDTYLRRIYVKLGVSDRVTAALRGLAIGAVR